MKKFLLVLMVMLFCATNCFAAGGVLSKVFENESVATENTVTSAVFPVKSSGYFGAWLDCNVPTGQAGIPKVNLIVESSYSATADTFAETNSTAYVLTAHDSSSPTVVTVTIPPMPYMRFKVGGIGTGSIFTCNTTGTTVTMYMFRQE